MTPETIIAIKLTAARAAQSILEVNNLSVVTDVRTAVTTAEQHLNHIKKLLALLERGE